MLIRAMLMIAFLIYTACVTFSLLCGLLAAIGDVRGMRIANKLSLAVVLSFCPLLLLNWYGTGAAIAVSDDAGLHVISFAGVFLTTLILFGIGVLGAGDSKLMSAYGLWLGPPGLVPFVLGMTLTGFVLALMALVIRRLKFFPGASATSWLGRLHAGQGNVPYGVAIFVGAVYGYAVAGYFNTIAVLL